MMDTYQILDLILAPCCLVLLWAVYKHYPRDKKPTAWHRNMIGGGGIWRGQ